MYDSVNMMYITCKPTCSAVQRKVPVNGGFETFVAWRYLLTKKKTGFISIISVISIAGIALGVAALIIVLSLMNGFTKELRMRLVGMDGHIWVSEPMSTGGMTDYTEVMDMLGSLPGVEGVSPFCTYKTVGYDRGQKHFAAMNVRGIDVSTIDDVSEIRTYITDGSLSFDRDENNIPGIVLGRYLAMQLQSYEIGDRIYLFGPMEEGDFESMFSNLTPPPIFPFRITGIFDSGYFEYDNSVALIDMSEAGKILGYNDRVTGIVMKLTNAFDAERYTKKEGLIENLLGGYPYYSEDWIEHNKILFNWMKLEKWASFIILSLIILVAAFNIVSSLIMMVMDKTREVGILKSMGATKSSIRRIFVYQGAFVGIVGTFIGSVLGYTVCYLQETYRILSLPSEIYFVSAVPVDLQMRDFVIIILVALFLCWISSFYPAKRAADLDPVEAIRSE